MINYTKISSDGPKRKGDMPTISVIIPTYNNGVELRRAILSIMRQDALLNNTCSVEIIIVNDGSNEICSAALYELTKEFTVCRLIQMKQQAGPAAARNTGIRSATGEIIGFLDADDEWPFNKLNTLLPYFQSDAIDVAGGKIKYIIKDGAASINMNFEDAQNSVTHVHLGALLVRKKVFEMGLYFDTTLTFSEDVDWWLRLREHHLGIIITEIITLLYHVHGKNMSINKSMEELQLLQIFHKSIRRREASPNSRYIPQLKDFRVHQNDPLISIILPLYNGKELVVKSLDSVLRQTYSHWELIIVDDGSTDQGADFIAAHYPQAIIIRKKNAGVAAARNTGIQHSKGDIVAFLDQDDEWLPTKLREQWTLLQADPYCSFVTCNQKFICMPGVTLPANFSEKLLEEHRAFVPSALLIRKQALLSVSMFDESLEVSSDFDLIRRLRTAMFKECNADKLLLHKWFHGSNASQNKPVLRNEILGLLYRQIKGR